MFCGWLSGKYIWWVNYFVKYILEFQKYWLKMSLAWVNCWMLINHIQNQGRLWKNIQISSIVQDGVLRSDFIKEKFSFGRFRVFAPSLDLLCAAPGTFQTWKDCNRSDGAEHCCNVWNRNIIQNLKTVPILWPQLRPHHRPGFSFSWGTWLRQSRSQMKYSAAIIIDIICSNVLI